MTVEELQQLEIIDEKKLEDMIYTIRGQKVMLDFELAKLYGYETKRFNEQIKNNINKFPPDFRFQISKAESEYLVMSQIVTSRKDNFFSGQSGGTRKLPYAFTEQGIYMLMTVLKGEIATEQSIRIIRVFKTMKDIVTNSEYLLTTGELLQLANNVHGNSEKIQSNTNNIQNNTERITELENRDDIIEQQLQVVMDYFADPSKYKSFIIKNGQRIEADIAYMDIYRSAKHSVIIVDDYINIRTLSHLKACSKNVDITIYSDNLSKDRITMGDINDFVIDTSINIKLKPTNGILHDRYIITDYKTDNEVFYFCGPSEKDAGDKIATIMEMTDKQKYHPIIDELINGGSI